MEETKKSYYVKLAVILIIGIIAGNRVFNHISAWGGIAIIVASFLFTIYKSIKTIKKNEEE